MLKDNPLKDMQYIQSSGSAPFYMPNLRGHHLICLHFFTGEGYNAGFLRNLKEVMVRVGQQNVNVCRGTDDVCGSCPHLRDSLCGYSETSDKEISDMDEDALELLNLECGRAVKWYAVRQKIQGIFSEWYAKYCTGCGWKKACEKDVSFMELKSNLK